MSDTALYDDGAVVVPKARRSQPLVGLAIRGLLLCAAYYFGSLLGYALIFPSSYISIIWPPNTILLVALLLSPRRHWPWLLLFPLPIHFLVQAQHEVSLSIASLYYVYNCGLVLLTAAAIHWVGLADLGLGELRKALIFIGATTIAIAVASLIWSPLIVTLWIGGDLWMPWGLAFLSNLLPFLIATPCLVIGLSRGARILRSTSPAQYAEFAVLGLGLLACAIGVFGLAPRAAGNLPALFYAPLPFLLWAAVRFGTAGLSFAFLIFALMAMYNAVAGHGPFEAQSAADSVLRLQFFLLALYVPKFVLASVIEERRAKEQALRESEARYRAVVEDQTELICRFLPDGTLTFMNGAYCRYYRCSPADLLGQTIWSFMPPDRYQRVREILASISPEFPVTNREHEALVPDGEIRWQRWQDRGLFDEHGRVVEYQAVGRDITERKQIEEARQELAHASRLTMLGELTASIAPEINQPLGAILSNADAAEMLLEASPVSLDEVRKILDDIRKDDLRASEVIRRLRTLLRKREMELVPVDLNEAVSEILGLIRGESRRREVAVESRLASDLPLVRGDKIHLQQILLNLFLNGMEAMAEVPGARTLYVDTVWDEDGYVEIAIRDNGSGIGLDRLHRVFEPFFSTKKEGMGLGLSIARSLVEAHGGRIWADNNPDGGATFRFNVPTVGHQSGDSQEPTK